MDKSNKIRTVYIHLSDGRLMTFSGPEQISDEELANLRITKTEFTHSRELPKDHYWEEIPRKSVDSSSGV